MIENPEQVAVPVPGVGQKALSAATSSAAGMLTSRVLHGLLDSMRPA
jgi:hypothetical protein